MAKNSKFAGNDAKRSGDAKWSGDEWFELDKDTLEGVAGGVFLYNNEYPNFDTYRYWDTYRHQEQ